MEEQFTNSDILYEEVLYFEQLVTDLEIELFTIPRSLDVFGIITTGIRELHILRRKLQNHKEYEFYLNQLDDLYQRLIYIEDIMYANSNSTLGFYLNQQASITHLVYTNNNCSNIKLYSTSGFMFLCQFHREKTPSLGITEGKGVGYCFGCGIGLNAVNYLMEFENLSYQETVQLLSKIYLIDISHNPVQENDPLVIKYRNTLLSDDFKALLEKGYQRVLKRGEQYNTYEILNSIKKFEHDFQTIERIKRNGHIPFDNRNKKYFLKMPDFNQPMGE